jgi:hypothetical protein
MRKRIGLQPQQETATSNSTWLALDAIAQVEVTSEDAAYPVESALLPGGEAGWRAEKTGEQSVRILFDEPRALRLIRLVFREDHAERTQEFVLRWAPAADGPWREIVRQQYHFSPPGTTEEREDYRVALEHVHALELTIVPNISRTGEYATLAELRLA